MSEPRLVPVVDVREAVDRAKVIAFSIGPAGEAIILAAASDDAAVARGRKPTGPTGPSSPYTQAERAYDATLLTFDGEGLDRRKLAAVTARFPVVQPLPYGEVLVVGPRSELRGDVRNATVYDRDGSVAREFLLGHGIQDVETTRDGAIWVSYFDEGILGNWPAGRAPAGASGLARFDSHGSVQWEFEPSVGGERIADCRALNVADDVVWAYYEALEAVHFGTGDLAFPLVRIYRGNVTSWKTPVSGARAIAVAANGALFVGGYRDDRARCVLCRFEESSLIEERRLTLPNPAGAPRIAARGSSVYVLDGTTLYRMDCTDL